MNFYHSMAMVFLLGFGIRFLYFRLKKGWIVTLILAVITGIAWISAADEFVSHREGESFLALYLTVLLAGSILGEIAVQLLRYRKKKKSSENTSKGDPT